jgi:hypothetical protein
LPYRHRRLKALRGERAKVADLKAIVTTARTIAKG